MSENNECPSCRGGQRKGYLSEEDNEACILCGQSPVLAKAERNRNEIILMRLDEAVNLLRLFRRQLFAGDAFRGFNLDRTRGLLNEISEIEAMPVSAFQRQAKKSKVNTKVE